jgi:SAM-dependent methyltransferase
MKTDRRFLFYGFTFIALSLLSVTACRCSKKHDGEAARFDRVARRVFKDVYPALARQILEDYQMREGLCLDLGCGPAFLSIELAKQSSLRIIGVDLDSEAVKIATRNVRKAGLSRRITVERGDVQRLRFPADTAALVVSRGSYLFWDDRVRAFREILRVLKPGGVAFVGGGMGRSTTPEQKEAIKKELVRTGIRKDCKTTVTPFEMEETLEMAGITRYRIMGDGPGDSGCKCGMWVEIRK